MAPVVLACLEAARELQTSFLPSTTPDTGEAGPTQEP